MRCTPILFLVLLVFVPPVGWAQQLPQYTLYLLNPYASNPAYAGLDNSLVVTAVHRQQWTQLQGAPVTQQLNASLPVYRLASGIGLRVENDVVGAHRVTQGVLSYSYHLSLGRRALLGIGASGGYLQYALDGTKLRAPEGTYAEPGSGTAFTHNDPRLPEGKVQAGTAVAEMGVFLKTDRLGIGLAVQPLFAPVLRERSRGRLSLKASRQYLAYASYELSLGDNFVLKPGLLLKTDIVETQGEISVLGRWRENIFAGLSYRGFTAHGRDAACLMTGFKTSEKVTLGYAYDIPLSPLQVANRGSHELLFRYDLSRPIGAGKLPPVIYNPRHF
ncbi:MAG TPA: type IX secretion system membrane protein PorP/SprF [Saprospiraceae bacterium]|nr:type IX secretion system membrane protein PorP/SprF [Saprospiraceae bacterium]HNG88639.1 type IX secretion system membrane protein PorP/SprF [Saprospiraceae bacterium]